MFVLALALTGCHVDRDDPQSPTPTSTQLEPRIASGSRLEAVAWEAAGEVLVFQTFRDTTIGIDCDFQATEDGTLRCMPLPELGVELVYLDAACTEPALSKQGSEPRPYESMRVIPQGDCDHGHTVVVRTGESLPVTPETRVFRDRRGNCLPADDLVPDTLNTYVHSVPEIFVAGDRLPAEVGDAWAAVLVAEDGARQVYGPGLSDASDCQVRATDGGERCLPGSTAFFDEEGPFGDATCTERVATTGDLPECIEWTATHDGEGNTTIHEVLDRYEGDRHVVGTTGSCRVDNDAYYGGFAVGVGEAIPSSDWPAIGHTDRGTSDLRQPWLTSGDGIPIAPERMGYEGSLFIGDNPCILAVLHGETVCIPEPSGPALFSNPSCTSPLISTPRTGVILWADEPVDPAGYPVVDAVYSAGGRYSGQVWEKPYGGPCQQYPWDAFAPVPFTPVTLTRASL